MDIDDTTIVGNSAPGEQRTPILEKRAYQLLDEGLYEDAGVLFSLLAKRSPFERAGHAGLAWTAEHQWRWKDAIHHWDDCIALGDDLRDDGIIRKAACLVQIGKVQEASQLLSSVTHRPEAVEGLARLAALQQPQEMARQAWEDCITEFPDRIEGYLGKARFLINREAYDEADELLGRVFIEWPDSVSARVLSAECAVALKNWPEAENRWRALIARHGGVTEVRTGYVRYLAVLGDRAAVTAYLAQLSGQPGTALAECMLWYHLASDNYGAALEQARMLVEAQRGRPDHRLRQADILLRHGSPAELHAALWILKDLKKQSPDSIWIKVRLAEALIRADAATQAASLISTIPQEDRRAEIEVLRAWRQHLLGNEAGCREHWDAALERSYVPALHAPLGRLTRKDPRNIEPDPGNILLFTAMRNEQPRLQWFLDYYRKLGVDKFIIVDNASTDSTGQMLLEQPDVILYHTADRYSLAACGVRWINGLIDKHGRHSWCVYVDADEALVFPNSETSSLRDLTESLSANGYEAMLAPLLDMYPAAIVRDGQDIESLQSSYCYFDGNLHVQPQPVCPYKEVYGGVRRRLFEGYQWLNKVPLINGSAGIRFLISTHRITPAKIADVTGALLHYHLINIIQPEFRSLLDEAIDNKEFPSNSLERLRSRDLLSRISPAGSLLGADSVKFQSTKQLLELGIIQPGAPAISVA